MNFDYNKELAKEALKLLLDDDELIKKGSKKYNKILRLYKKAIKLDAKIETLKNEIFELAGLDAEIESIDDTIDDLENEAKKKGKK